MPIDEVQRVPELWLAIKHLVDRDPRPGRFLLTGSARLPALRSLPDALPGRSETESVRAEDFRGLRLLRRRSGDRFRAGFVLYCGTESLTFGDDMVALPMSALWTSERA